MNHLPLTNELSIEEWTIKEHERDNKKLESKIELLQEVARTAEEMTSCFDEELEKEDREHLQNVIRLLKVIQQPTEDDAAGIVEDGGRNG